MSSWAGFGKELLDFGRGAADIHATIKSTDAISKDGVSRVGVRPETVADQTSVGIAQPAQIAQGSGGAAGVVNVLGVPMSSGVLTATAVLLIGILVVRGLK